MTEQAKQSIRRRLEGVVVSTAMNKTCTVRVSRLKKHSKYLKYYKRDRKFKAHDKNEQCKVGDKVFIEETRPMSKEKRWRVVGKVEV